MLRRFVSLLGLLEPARFVKETLIVAGAWWGNRRIRKSLPTGEIPVPGARLIYRVAGTPDLGWFLEGGKRAAQSIRSALASESGVRVEDLTAVLDFGCGCGRVARQWQHLTSAFHGVDVRPELVEWCRRHLAFGSFQVTRLDPPLPFSSGNFDLIYALSVFTHLDEPRQLGWIAELSRVLRPGGYLIITTHGERYGVRLPHPLSEDFRAGRLVVQHSGDAGHNVCGAYHPEQYVRQILAEGWEVVSHAPEGAQGNPHQDLWLLRKPASS